MHCLVAFGCELSRISEKKSGVLDETCNGLGKTIGEGKRGIGATGGAIGGGNQRVVRRGGRSDWLREPGLNRSERRQRRNYGSLFPLFSSVIKVSGIRNPPGDWSAVLRALGKSILVRSRSVAGLNSARSAWKIDDPQLGRASQFSLAVIKGGEFGQTANDRNRHMNKIERAACG